MRIIDKNVDFYDYLQDYSDTIVFDRRNSWLLTKQEMLRKIAFTSYGWGKNFRTICDEDNYRFILLQCGATFWLFYMEITERDSHGNPADYTMELIISWKNFNKKREIIKLQSISICYPTVELFSKGFWDRTVDVDKLKIHAKEVATAIDNNNYNEGKNLGTSVKSVSYKMGWKNDELSIPLLKACGIGKLVDPIEIFSAIEEHFSLEKTEAERTEPLGATNDDKITMHGFDTKKSFRGKRK